MLQNKQTKSPTAAPSLSPLASRRSGGLVIFTTKPPAGWDFEAYNKNTARVVDELLRPAGFANVTVPHRANRAVIFDSALFHHTDECHFVKEGGPTKRRINLTLLYGTMKPPGQCIERGG